MGFWKWVEKCLVIDDHLPLAPVDAVIGIGIGVSKNGYQASTQSKKVAELAYETFRQGWAPLLIFTGGLSAGQVLEARGMFNHIFPRLSRDLPKLKSSGKKIRLELLAKHTWQNADYTLPIVQRAGCRKVIIVAQQWHARRVLATFRKRWAKAGITIYIAKAWSPYGEDNSKKRLGGFWIFLLWDSACFWWGKLKGWC